MMRGVWPLLIESALILLQTVPTHIDVDVLKKKLLENIDGILAVHDFHVWQLTGDKIIASAHIRCLNLSEYMKVSMFYQYNTEFRLYEYWISLVIMAQYKHLFLVICL